MVDPLARATQRAQNLSAGRGPSYWALINEVLGILGTTNRTLWPFWENTGSVVTGIGATDLTSRDEAGAKNLEDEWNPKALAIPSNFAVRNVAATNNHFQAGDNAAYTFGNGTVDVPFSAGIWIAPLDITSVALLGKYVAAAEEWALRIDSSSFLELELHDAGASADETATGTTAIVLGEMQFVGFSYDGVQTEPGITFFVNGQPAGAAVAVETNSYGAMEDTATPLLIGATGLTAAPTEEYDGWLTLPFVTGKALSEAEWATLYQLERVIVGV